MKTTEYLDALKRGYKLESDYALAKHMGWSEQRISGYRHRRTFDEMTAIQVAMALWISPHKVLADMQAERAKEEPIKRIWNEVADQLEKAGIKSIAVAAISTACAFALTHAPEATAAVTGGVCILC